MMMVADAGAALGLEGAAHEVRGRLMRGCRGRAEARVVFEAVAYKTVEVSISFTG